MKLRRSGDEFWQLLQDATIEISFNINGIEVTVEKRNDLLPKVTDEMSKDQRSENVQQPL